jgi:multidrug efflux pump subunit AcrA (membrane-fusion protein)
MKKSYKIALIALLLIAVGGFSIWKFVWNKDHRTAEDEKPVATVTASALLSEYETDETASNTKYLNKTVQVNGTVNSVSKDESGTIVVLLATESMMGVVSCTFSAVNGKPSEVEVKEGDQINVKGICSGYTIDVVLEQCSLVK